MHYKTDETADMNESVGFLYYFIDISGVLHFCIDIGHSFTNGDQGWLR
jgi:hypothetical protein